VEQSTELMMQYRRMLEAKSTDLKIQRQTIRPMNWLWMKKHRWE
jgi:hypothetical protein